MENGRLGVVIPWIDYHVHKTGRKRGEKEKGFDLCMYEPFEVLIPLRNSTDVETDLDYSRHVIPCAPGWTLRTRLV